MLMAHRGVALGRNRMGRPDAPARPATGTPRPHECARPWVWQSASLPPHCPARSATNVPISTMPLPPVSSEGLSTCGRYANFAGPKKVECTPMPTRHSSSNSRPLHDQTQQSHGHDGDFAVFDPAHQHRFVHAICQLPGRGRQQHKGRNEQRANHQARHRRWQPCHLQLIGHQYRQGELEQVVVARPPETGSKKMGQIVVDAARQTAGWSHSYQSL